MKAVDFIKKFGWVVVQKGLKNSKPHDTYLIGIYNHEPKDIDGMFFIDRVCYQADIEELKRYVDAWELVEYLGGMDMAKDILDIEIHEPHYNYDAEKVTRIEQAIELVKEVENANN